MSAVAENYAAALATARPVSTLCTSARFVVLDTETTGLDPRSDRLISIGAVAWVAGEVRVDDTFEVVMPIAYNKAAVTLHGITRDASQNGLAEADALAAFLDYLGSGVMVAHHLNHDWRMLAYAAREHHGVELANARVDTAVLADRLLEAGAFGVAEPAGTSLDALCARFGLIPHDRHTAAGDAFLTALVFQRLAVMAMRRGWERVSDLMLEEDDDARNGS